MKRKNLPLSALLSGLLAMPGMGLAPPALGESRAPLVQAEPFPAAMPNDVAEQIRRIARGEKPDANGMQSLQRRLALEMQQRLATLAAQAMPADLLPVQLTQPAVAPGTPALPAPTSPVVPAGASAPAATPNGTTALQRVQTRPDFQRATEVVNTRAYGSSFDAHPDGSLTRRTYDDKYDITINRTAAGVDTITAKDLAGTLLVQATGDQLAQIKMPADLLQKIQDARANVNQAHVEIGSAPPAVPAGTPVAGNSATVSRTFVLNHTDETYEIAYHSVNGDGRLTVKNLRSGTLLYDGPANSPDDYKTLPDDLRAKVQTLLQKAK